MGLATISQTLIALRTQVTLSDYQADNGFVDDPFFYNDRRNTRFFIQKHVIADQLGPGLDGKQDQAMFILLEMELPSPHQLILYDDKDNVIAKSKWTHAIFNRLYIGQFEEIKHLKDGTLRKAIPCRTVFPFLNEGYLLNMSFSRLLSQTPRLIKVADCKLIFNIRYHTNTSWNPIHFLFSSNHSGFRRGITIEWGIHIHDESSCRFDVQPLCINDFFTNKVLNDLIKYTCSSSCGDDANICDNAHYWKFSGSNYIPTNIYLDDFFFTINDLKVADSCQFETIFVPSLKVCDKSWAEVETVQVPPEIQQTYPQFITFPGSTKALTMD